MGYSSPTMCRRSVSKRKIDLHAHFNEETNEKSWSIGISYFETSPDDAAENRFQSSMGRGTSIYLWKEVGVNVPGLGESITLK